ncbi:RNA polymerase I-specific transcription initiation factor RRN3-like isoform X1 [Drosophila subpulchrella]|uniref:RNA polymerase I-specific transcription initiation factor RRN3-like isoform X1 n=1 Tax=Drosophila subpulchrella TaxID=1486046 RepID=UPI0018A13FE0|nr:RNA polymerase I-specific transcription initiation factor RRN3-like isoform X1 [Drosophila subpulchrella]
MSIPINLFSNCRAIHNVRSDPKNRGLAESIRVALKERKFQLIKEFTIFLCEAKLKDDEVLSILKDAKEVVQHLTPVFLKAVKALLSLNWKKRSSEIIEAYIEFYVDLLMTHNQYLSIGVFKLIEHWIPEKSDKFDWVKGCPSERSRLQLKAVHDVLNRILNAAPMTFQFVCKTITDKFPYYKRPAYVTAGYVYNVLWLIEYKPIFEEPMLQLVLQRFLLLDVNAPREEIGAETDDEDDNVDADRVFQMDDVSSYTKTEKTVKHPVGKTLDICLFMLYRFIDEKCRIHKNSTGEQRSTAKRIFNLLLHIFDDTLLPSYNTHHVQFVLFYVTSIRVAYSEAFLDLLWQKVQNPQISPIIGHAAVGYMTSFLSRARFLPLSLVQYYLKKMSIWAHTYIDDSSKKTLTWSFGAHLVFYSVCETIFYLIASRARYLTDSSKDLHFLECLQLSRIAGCHLNPLRYCLASVATAFADVSRTYQLAYCYTVLHSSPRRKLPIVSVRGKCKTEEKLETLFPFNHYVLKLSKKYIEANFIVHQCKGTDNCVCGSTNKSLSTPPDDEEDDFIISDMLKHLEMSTKQ